MKINGNDIYIALVDDVLKELNEVNPKNKDGAMKIKDEIENKLIDSLDTSLEEILNDYCVEKGLKWEDEEN